MGPRAFAKMDDSHVSSSSSDPQKPSKLDMFRELRPFLLPKFGHLRLRILVVFLLIVGVRGCNIYTPILFKNCVDSLSAVQPSLPMFNIVMYAVLRILVSVQRDIRSLFWLPVEQYTRRSISLYVFRHLHSLSLRFHLNRKTGEVLRVIERGTTSIETLFNTIVFSIGPTLFDVGTVCVVFITYGEVYQAAIVFVTILLYCILTWSLTEWRTKFRKQQNEADNKSDQKAIDSLLNFETVKYFTGEEMEARQYEKNLLAYSDAAWKSEASLLLLDGVQAVLLNGGLLLGLLLAAKNIVDGTNTLGNFILVNSYLLQVAAPLNWLGSSYRIIQRAFVDMESMVLLMKTNAEIKDDPDCVDVAPISRVSLSAAVADHLRQVHVEFCNVDFSYTENVPVLRNITFRIFVGQSVALVGPSGSGKSTVFRLLFRFYDVDSGCVSLLGTDVRKLQLQSLRSSIGVVPQDTVLFNDTIGFNIQYAKPDATQEEIETAAKAAAIHDRIVNFPLGYDTMVGERGLRLSGGEKQRVAIARVLLKNPGLVVLDEASSALDTKTERSIQDGLLKVTEGRTTISIAHRLSTIVNSSCIFVLRDGAVIEEGTHRQLLERPEGT